MSPRSDGEYKRSRGNGSDPRFRHDHGVPITSFIDGHKLAEEMLELAERFKVKLGQGWQHDRWQLAEGDSFGLALCSTGACENCGREMISAAERGEHRRRGWLCVTCAPFSAAGYIDHAAWVAQRRAA